MTHAQTRQAILTGRVEPLTAVDRRALEEHLATCPSCSQYADEVERGLQAFRSQAVQVDAEVLRRTRARLRAEVARRSALSPWVLAGATTVAGAGLAEWALFAERFGDWWRESLGMSAAVAVGWAAFVWLLPSALAAVAILVAAGLRLDPFSTWQAEAIVAREVSDGR